MKRKTLRTLLCVLLVVLELFSTGQAGFVYAADELDKTIHPAKRIEVTVPESLQNGEIYFFIREDSFTISEKSSDKLYIPIQRTGAADEAADVSLKLIDMSARCGVNYEAELYEDPTPAATVMDGIAVIDLFLDAEVQVEQQIIDEDELGAMLGENGGSAEVLDPEGEAIGAITATPLDENGDPIPKEADEAPTTAQTPAAPQDEVQTEAAPAQTSGPSALRAARNEFTGTVSDRQQFEGGENILQSDPAQRVEEAKREQLTDQQIAEESYPGREYPVHFEAGESVKFLVITPKYSEAADGDSSLMLMLKDLPENASVPEDFNMRTVVITDEDEAEPVTVSMANAEIRAAEGKALVTITREGAINDVVGVMLSSQNGSAVAGDDYSGVGAKVWFSMGLRSRTVEIPVGHGAEEKDFTLTIAPLPEARQVQIGQASSHVIIPAATSAEEAELMISNDPYGDEWNLRDRKRTATDKVEFQSDTAVYMETKQDKCQTQYISLYTYHGYAWDGIHVEYDYHTWYSKGCVDVEKNTGDGTWHRVYRKDWGDCSWKRNQSLDAYFGDTYAPWLVSIDNFTYEVHNGFRDSHSDLWVKSVRPIKRKFTIKMLEPKALAFEGMTDTEVLNRYEQVMLDSSLDTSVQLYTGDNFSISRLSNPEMARLVGIDAVGENGSTFRIASINGSSGTATVELTPDLINDLSWRDMISWQEKNGSYSGTIKVRPVFDYVKNVSVMVRETPYGSLCLEKKPILRWEFDGTKYMDASMGKSSLHNVSWSGERAEDGNDYYTFTATGDDPYVSIDMPFADASKLVWAKVRARNLSGADAIELFGRFNDNGPHGNSCVHIDLEHDTEWHTYLINVPEENVRTVNAYKGETITETTWKGKANWLRLDPMWKENGTTQSGDQIQIDYIAFFSTKAEAESYHTGTGAGAALKAGAHRFHYGDKLVFIPNLESAWAGKMRALGVSSEARRDGASGIMVSKNDGYYVGVDGADSWSLTLDQDYYEFWQFFTDVDNLVEVQVPASDLAYFDTSKGLFAGLTPTESGGYWIYQIKANALTNELIDLIALPKSKTDVPVWTIAGNSTTYSGSEFCFFAGVQASDNLVTLRMDQNAAGHAWYSLRGTACYSTHNLSTGNEADDLFPAEGAIITAAGSGAMSDEYGLFTMQPAYLVGGSTVRCLVNFNGTTFIKEVKLAQADAARVSVPVIDTAGNLAEQDAIPMNLGNVKVEGWSRSGAHFSGVDVKLNGFNDDAVTTIEMNGKTLTVNITVDPGQQYIWDGQKYSEHITEVKLWFQNQRTGDIHGVYSTTLKEGETKPGLTWNQMTNTATLTIREFDPTAPEKYTYGDVIMVQLITDKKSSASEDDPVMVYQPVSTGYAVVTDQDYEPKTYEEDMDIASMLDATLSADDGEGGNTRHSFGKFPWLGNITAAVSTFSYFISSGYDSTAQHILDDLELMEADENAELMDAGVLPRRGGISAAVAFKDLPYGGVRTMIAVAFSAGNSTYSRQANPYSAKTVACSFLQGITSGKDGDMIYNGGEFGSKKCTKYDLVRSELGGGYIYFTIFVGLYCDWGFTEEVHTDENGEVSMDHGAVFLGAGGFYGIRLTGGYTQYVFPFGIPVYFNIEAQVDLTVYLGASADPKKTLESYYDTSDHKGQDFAFSMEIYGDVGLKLTIGVGLYKILGLRASGGVGLQAGLSLRMADWFPDLQGSGGLSYSTDAMFAGSIDLIVTSIDLWSASWPLPLGYGWLQYFQQMKRANTLIHFIMEATDGSTDPVKVECRNRAIELGNFADAYNSLANELRKKIDSLNDYAYDNGVISLTKWRRVNMIRQGGLGGNISDWVILTDDEPNSLFHTRDHVDSKWVAGENASLQAAFGPVSTAKILENAVSQPAAQIASIGDNCFLVVFLDDDTSRERQQASALYWTVYDASANTWTEPKMVQDDGTADGRASLIDADGKLILTWPSIAKDSYDALKQTVAAELKEKNGVDATAEQIQAELEKDPARLMMLQEIYSVEFRKHGSAFGPITRLTDDDYADDGPQVVYDTKTGDYIVLYYKTAQDTEAYDSAEDRLLDLVGSNADPKKTYNVLCYMLYNNQTTAEDTRGNTHAAGWARDYLFDNETAQDLAEQEAFLAQWGGQRFLASAIKTEEGGQTDAPIADLTVCNGYNGLATYAFTVDKDFNVDTSEDKDLYVQFYRFADHTTYVPIKVAGEATKLAHSSAVRDENNVTVTPASSYETTVAVDVGQPKLIRNEGSTWLFWREDEDGLRYLNISDMLNEKVGTGPNEDDWTYALQDDGTFAADYATGETWKPTVQRVDFGYGLTDGDLNATDYQVITDKDDNLYVIWTDVDTYSETDEVLGDPVVSQAQAIYASAKIKQTDEEKNGEISENVANWSKPYRLTRDNSSNDGVSVALDENGGLILIHNQYQLELADTEEEIAYMIDNKLAGIYHDEEDGRDYFLGYPYYTSDLCLAVTRCEPIGSVEATDFEFTDDTPVAGQTIGVTAIVENAGLTNALGCEVSFYECKDGVQGKLLKTVSNDSVFRVNTAAATQFDWTVPADGPEGYSIKAVAREKTSDGGWYDPVETSSEVFHAAPEYELVFTKCVQNGDSFDVEYSVTNTGNLPIPEGIKANLVLEGLYGDLKEKYGVDDEVLVTEDISGLAPNTTRTVTRTVTIPLSVFRFCGYDAVTVVVKNAEDLTVTCTDHNFITLDAPLNLSLNGGRDLKVQPGSSRDAALTYDATLFMEKSGTTVWSVEDPTIAYVDKKGQVTGLSNGVTTLTATLLPSGRSVSTRVEVGELKNPFVDVAEEEYYYDPVLWAYYHDPQITTGTDDTHYSPEEGCTRAQVVTFLWRAAGKPAAGGVDNPFKDLDKDEYYYDAVLWAVENGITTGTEPDEFSPNETCTRAQIVTFLWRYEKKPDPASADNPFKDVAAGEYYYDAVLWAVGEGITKGTDPDKFSPDDTCTRAQIVTFLYRKYAS